MTRTIRIVCALLALAGIGSAAAQPSPRASAPRELVIGLQLEPPNLDPTSGAAAATDEVVSGTIVETLTTLDRAGEPQPLLATGWQVSADGLRYRFALRPGVRFADGMPFTAEAARRSLLRSIAPESTNGQAEALSVIRTVTADGPLTLTITLKRTDAELLRLLAYGDAGIVSPSAVGRLATDPVGTGPFRLTEWRRGDSILLAANAHWWGGRPGVDRLRFRVLPDPAAALAAVEAGEVALFPDFPAPESMARLARRPGLAVNIGPTQAEVILALNNARPPFRSLAVRRALAMAIDRRAIIDGAMAGHGTTIGSHFPPQDPSYVDLTNRIPHDPAAARRVLAALPPVTLALPPPPYARRSGEIVAAQLRAAGLRVRIENLEWAQWLDRVYARHEFDMTIVAHVEPYDYAIYGRRDYYFGYDGRAVAALLDQLRTVADPLRRRALLQAVQRRIADDAVNVFLFQMPRLGVADVRLLDVWADTPLRSVDFARVRFAGGGGGAATREAGGTRMPWGAMLLAASAVAALLAAVGLGARRLLGRAALLGATLLCASLVVFLLLQVAPGNPAQFMMGVQASAESVAALQRELGLDGPAWRRYLEWLAGLATGNLGLSYTYRVPVADVLVERLAVSLPLAVLATVLSLLLALPAALAGAARPGGVADRLLGSAARLLLAVPSYWLGLLMILLLSGRLGWSGAGGFPGWEAGVGAALGALLLPAAALAGPQAAVLARVYRAALAREAAQRHVLTARAKGLGERRILWRHVAPNAAPALLAVLGLQLPFLLAGAVIVESVFALPGLGRLILQAVAQRDLPVIQSAVMLMVAATVIASFATDLAATAIDPRLRR